VDLSTKDFCDNFVKHVIKDFSVRIFSVRILNPCVQLAKDAEFTVAPVRADCVPLSPAEDADMVANVANFSRKWERAMKSWVPYRLVFNLQNMVL